MVQIDNSKHLDQNQNIFRKSKKLCSLKKKKLTHLINLLSLNAFGKVISLLKNGYVLFKIDPPFFR
jgi:hypothetical protein